MTKLEAQYQDLQDALKRLKAAAKLSGRVMINRDATIKRFEFTFEIAWKLMQTVVGANIKDVYGPRSVIREAAKLGLINDILPGFLSVTRGSLYNLMRIRE